MNISRTENLSPTPPIEVFFSYAHEDEELKNTLVKHLSNLKRQKVITDWHDRDISAGKEWASEIDIHLNTASIILLLISADFIASNYCYDIELTCAMERHIAGNARVIPVILRSVDWKGLPFSNLQALPKDAKPVNDWEDQDQAFADVAEGIRKTVEELKPVLPINQDYCISRHDFDSLPKTQPKYFSKINTIHVHIDGATEHELVQSIVLDLKQRGMESKITSICRAIQGSDRQKVHGKVYELHTPETDEQNQWEYFSTTLLPKKSEIPNTKDDGYTLARRELKLILASLSNTKGIVIEVERVIGKIGKEIEWIENYDDNTYTSSKLRWKNEVGFEEYTTNPVIETHYAIDIKKIGDWQKEPPIKLEILLEKCSQLSIPVGGWFLFDKGEVWAYRSNSFAMPPVSKEEIKQKRDAFAQDLENLSTEKNFEYEINVLVEQVLGIWKTPLKRTYDFKTVKELAKWERDYLDLNQFWVVSPNFLGDKNDLVYTAMTENLRKRVEYTYFVPSYSDFQRLQKFTDNLKKTLSDEIDISKQIKAVLFDLSADPKNTFDEDCFIANPYSEKAQGYKLIRCPETREVFEGRQIDQNQIKRNISLLKPLFESLDEKHQLNKWIRLFIKSNGIPRRDYVLICTDIDNNTESVYPANEKKWVEMLQKYDLIVAEEVSKLEGVVVRIINDGYLITFKAEDDTNGSNIYTAVRALHCAERLQKAVLDYNSKRSPNDLFIPSHKIALDYGKVWQLIRDHGNDIVGETLNRCNRLVKQMDYEKIYVTKHFYDYMYRENDSSDFFYPPAGWNLNEDWFKEKFILKNSSPFNCYEVRTESSKSSG